MSKAGVVLCECNGAVERQISLQELTHFLNNAAPNLDVVIGNNLCKKKELKGLLDKSEIIPSVICACNKIDNPPNFWQELDSVTINPYFTKVVDILSEIDSNYSSSNLLDRIKLLTWSKILRSLNCDDISTENLKTRFGLSNTEVSRRDLLGALMPQYEIVPFISTSSCAGEYLCGLCKSTCPTKSIFDSLPMRIDKSSCSGCGACVEICPHSAISYPTFSIAELAREAAGLLSNGVTLSPRIIAVTCRSCADKCEQAIQKVSPHIFKLEVPSLAMASPLLLLTMLNKGAAGVILIDSDSACSSEVTKSSWDNGLHFVQDLLDVYGIEQERIGYIEIGLDSTKSRQELQSFISKITKFGPPSLKTNVDSDSCDDIIDLSETIKALSNRIAGTSEIALKKQYVPFGIVTIETKSCTGCGVCTENCPTGALSKKVDADSIIAIIFRHDKCLACGICTKTCPEKCIRLTNMLDVSKLSTEQTVFEDEYAYCRNCNRIIAPKSMVNILKSKLKQPAGNSLEWSELCPACRVVIQQKR